MNNGKKSYEDWHWGIEPTEVVKVKPPSVVTNPKDKKKWENMNLVECGRLVEIHYVPLNANAKKKDKIIKLSRKNSNQCHLAFDNDHHNQRLYFILNKDTQNRMKRELYKKNPNNVHDITEIAKAAGGLHASDDYEKIKVNPIGIMTNVVYACEKKGDGYSFYIHAMGEESGIRPVLGVAKDGSLWIAGGNYTAPIQGITD